jgi:hypothetical protein
MKSMKLSRLTLIAMTILTSGCGRQTRSAQLNDIGTDLNSGSAHMYWVDGQNVVQGLCTAGQPLVRNNCSSSSKAMLYNDFQFKILDPIEQQIAAANGHVVTWQNEFDAVDRARRNDPNNSSVAAEWRYVKGQLDRAKCELTRAQQAQKDATTALNMLADRGMTYRVTRDNTRYPEVRPAVSRFYEVFLQLPPPVPPVPPQGPQVSWIDTVSNKTWGLFAEQLSWTEADNECKRRPGWRLPMSHQDFEIGDNNNLDVARRLMGSPIGAALRQLNYRPVSGGSDYLAKVVWTGDSTPSADYGALLYVFADIPGHGLDRYMHLKSAGSRYSVICVKD